MDELDCLFGDPASELVEQVFFAINIIIKAARKQPHTVCDIVYCRIPVAPLDKYLAGSFHDLTPPLLIELAALSG